MYFKNDYINNFSKEYLYIILEFNTEENVKYILKLLKENKSNKQFIDPIIRIYAAIIPTEPCLSIMLNDGLPILLSILKGVESIYKIIYR